MSKRKRSAASGGKRPSRQSAMGHREIIYGIHAVRAALGNPRRNISGLFATKNGRDRLDDIAGKMAARQVEVSPDELTRRLGRDAVHQGVMIETAPLEPVPLESILEGATHSSARRGPILVLDQVTDPHNVGAILRSAAVFDAPALLMTRRNSPPLEGALAKAACGGVEHVPVVLVPNLARALEALGRAGVYRIGLDGDADQPLETASPQQPCALVLGSEHKGLRRLTAENCDLLCRLTTPGVLSSLNVSNAAAIALHTLTTRDAR